MNKNVDTQVKKHFDKISADYDEITGKPSFKYYLKRRKEHLSDMYKNSGKDKIVGDLAAGTGAYSDVISDKCLLINMDLSIEALKVKRKGVKTPLKVNASALNIPIKDNSADSVLLIGLLHHVPKKLDETFREVARILKPGGTVVIDEPNGYNLGWFVFMKCCEIDRIGARPIFPSEIKKFANKYSLKIENELYWGLVPSFINKEPLINRFDSIEKSLKETFLKYLFSRYQLVLKK